MRDFLINQIRQFNPSYVMISYSGRITIDDGHFVELMQQLTKVSNYKLIFYPNLTTAFCSEEMMQIQDQDGNECDYDNFINDKKIESFLNKIKLNKEKLDTMNNQQDFQEEQREECTNNPTSVLQLFNKVARFLKISSGTYNLTKNSQEEPLISKFKNQFILSYTDELMTCLGKEYYSIDRIRFKNKDLTIIPKLFEQNLNAIKKAFGKTVPQFYMDLYRVLEILLFNKQRMNKQEEELLNTYKIIISEYEEDVLDLWDQLTKSSSIQISSIQKQQYTPLSFTANTHSNMIENQSMEIRTEKKDIIEQIQQLKIKKINKNFYLQNNYILLKQVVKNLKKESMFIQKRTLNLNNLPSISQQTEETQGLYDVIFLRKDKSQIKIFENTKILYRNDQQNRQNNYIPILIMNNLSDEKPNYYENYIADLDVNDEPNKQRKNIEQKKVLVIPIVLKDQDMRQGNNSKSFIVKTDWNFHETKNHIILYWPTQFDFLKAITYKMLNKNYSPALLSDIYISSKQMDKHIFRKVPNIMTQTSILPRMGCSSYEFQSKLFIFGGFYDKQKNYLNFQHDITMFDLLTYDQSNGESMRVENLKGTLYSQENFNIQVQTRKKYNSFVRPKMQFQIFNKSELADWHEQNHQIKEVILFGGYGQNFLRPFSMLTYYYYELKFSYETRSLCSIDKKIIYDKTIPINVKQMTKNMGIIKTNKKNPNTNVLQTNKVTEQNSYLTFRNSFKLQKNADNTEDLKYKYRYMFAEDQYKNFKTQIKKVQQQRTQQFDSSTISVEKMEGNNHLISLEKDGKKCVISLHLQIPHEKAKKLGCSRQVKLTHQSIINIDFWNSMICAIVKHDFYTKGKSVLVEYNIKSLQNLSFNQDQIPHIALTWIKQFDVNLGMHILIACNKNTIAILHGQKLINTDKIREFIVKKKKNKTQAIAFEIQQRIIPQFSNARLQYCFSVFFKQRNKILCIQYLSQFGSSNIVEISHQIELNSANDVYFWQSTGVRPNQADKSTSKLTSFYIYNIVYLERQNQISIPLHKLVMNQYLKVQKQQPASSSQIIQQQRLMNKKPVERIIQILYNKKIYYLQLGPLNAKGNQQGVSKGQVLQMIPGQNFKIQKQNIQRGTILPKKLEDYYDMTE